MRHQPKILEDDADLAPERRQIAARQPGEVLAEQRDEPARRMLGEADQAQQRRLAGARGSGEEMERARRQVQGDVAQHLGSEAVAHADILEAHHGSAKMTRRARGRKAARRLASPPGAP